jgi:hypothetical protein
MKCLDCGYDLTMDEAEEHREMGHTVKSGFFEGEMNWQEQINLLEQPLTVRDLKTINKALDEAEQRGIRKAFEKINYLWGGILSRCACDESTRPHSECRWCDWQAFLKSLENGGLK